MDNRRRMMLATLGGGTLSNLPVGSILKILEGGVLTDFYVAKHNYESGLNGAGRTLLVRKDCYDLRQWHSSLVNAYASSDIDSSLNSGYKPLFSSEIQAAIGTTRFYYTPGNGNLTVDTLSRAVFLLSVTELGKTATYANAEGTALPIASTLQIAYDDGYAVTQWTRTPATHATGSACYLQKNGRLGGHTCTDKYWSRPVFTLPAKAPCELNADGSFTLLL